MKMMMEMRTMKSLLDRRAGAEEIAVAPDVVDPAHGRPEFVLAEPRGRVGGLLAGVGAIPSIRADHFGGMGSVFEQVICRVDFAFFDRGHLPVDRNKGVAEAVE